MYLPGAFDIVMKVFSKNPDIGAVYGDFIYIDEHDHLLRKRHVLRTIDYDLLLAHNYIGQPSLFFRRSILDKIGYLDERFHYIMDWDLVLRLAKTCEMKHVPQFLATARIHRATKTAVFGNLENRSEIEFLHKTHQLSGKNYNSFYRMETLFQRIHIVFRDGPISFVRVFLAQYPLTMGRILRYITWRIFH
jgi:GT2 family glycosyltransferase